MAHSEPFDKHSILFVGRDGNGKTSCKQSIEKVSDEFEVVDFSGLGDTESDRFYDIDVVRKKITSIMENYDEKGGFKAIGFVLKYGVRFTQQEKDAVKDVKAMLGEDVFCNNGFILMSYGDLFELDKADEGCDFMIWCREQTGEIKKMFMEVNYRIVLFNNRTHDTQSQQEQYAEIRAMVTSMGNPYGLIEFSTAQELRSRPIGIIPSYTSQKPLNTSPISGCAYKKYGCVCC